MKNEWLGRNQAAGYSGRVVMEAGAFTKSAEWWSEVGTGDAQPDTLTTIWNITPTQHRQMNDSALNAVSRNSKLQDIFLVMC